MAGHILSAQKRLRLGRNLHSAWFCAILFCAFQIFKRAVGFLVMTEIKKALRAAFPHTVPVMVGYLFLGVAFGVLLQAKGFGFQWAVLMSAVIYAGSMQFVAINFLVPGVNLLQVAFMTLMVNARHVFYGVSMLEPFRNMGKRKPYMIFSLSDETFSLLCSAKAPEGVDRRWFLFFIALLDQLYWIIGSALGGLAGALLQFDTTGIDFAMTALFTVILVDQWRGTKRHAPAVVGLAASALCLAVFGPDRFILPAMGLILLSLTLARGKLEEGGGAS